MKIVQLVTRRQRRGAEVFAGQLSDELVQRGHEVELVGLYAPSTEPLLTAHASVYNLNGRETKLSFTLVRQLAQYLARVQPDLVQANGSDTLKYSVLARWWSGGTWPLVYRNISMASRWLHLPLQRFWMKGLLHAVDHVAAVSHQSKWDLHATFGLPEERISAIPIGVWTEPVYDSVASREHLAALGDADPSSPFLIHVGSYTPEKNHQWMIRAFRRVCRDVPAAQLFLLGDGPLRERIKVTVRQEGVSDAVHMLGSRDDVSRCMAGADVLLLPSLVEGIPGVILEAAAQGVPAVANDVGAVSEAVEDGTNGRIVSEGDTEAFCIAVTQLLNDDEVRRRMGEHGRRIAVERYDLKQIISSFESLYARLVTGKSAGAAAHLPSH